MPTAIVFAQPASPLNCSHGAHSAVEAALTPSMGNPSCCLGMLPGERPDKSVPRGKGADDAASSLRNHPTDFWEGRVCPGKANAAA